MGAPSWINSRTDMRDSEGLALVGCSVEFYDAGTDSPRTVYTDSTLSTPWDTNLLVTDAQGRWPRVFLQLGLYREKVLDPTGVVLWDDDNIEAAPTQPTEEADVVDPNALYQTGDIFFTFTSGTRDGAVRANAGTIGNSTSGASERANADAEPLYTLLWNIEGSGGNTLYPVSGGSKGATAAADFAASKTIQVPDMRGRFPVGPATMGNAASGRLAGVSFNAGGGVDTPGSSGGAALHTLLTAEMPSHNHNPVTITDPGHFHTTTGASQNNNNAASGSAVAAAVNGALTSDTKTTGISASTSLIGGGGAHNNMPPFFMGTWRIKL